MGNQLHNELRKEFQLERMLLFSDAVFAIAITLLVIEIKIPGKGELGGAVTDQSILRALGKLLPKFGGFVVSFFLIGLYWTVHHRMFGFVTSYSRKLLLLNLVFLFFVALMPFSTGFYSEYTGADFYRQQLIVPMTFYVLNFCGMGFLNYFMWDYITNPKNKVAEPPIDPLVAKQARTRSLVVPFIFLFMLPIAYFTNVIFAAYVPMLIPVILRIMKKKIEKKYN